MRAKYRHGYDKPQLLEPGVVEKYTIYMEPIAYTFKKGNKIRFSITSSSKFVAFPNSNTRENPYEDSEELVVTQSIFHTEEYPSHLFKN